MALCLHLAFWTGGDQVRMDRLFRKSGLMRAKWDQVHYADGATYGERTIERALEMVDEVYEPDQESGGQPPVLQVSDQSGNQQRDNRSKQLPRIGRTNPCTSRNETGYCEKRSGLSSRRSTG